MSRITRIAVLVAALLSLLAVLSSPAGAVTWHNTGSSAFHATGAGGTFSVGPNSFTCTGSTASGTAPIGTFSPKYTMSATVRFAPCTFLGQQNYMHCNFTMTLISQPVAGQAIGAADVTCDYRVQASNTKLCHVEGTTPFSYFNPVGATPGRITLNTSGTGLTMTNAGATNCPWGIGTVHVGEQTLTLTSGGPILTRTA